MICLGYIIVNTLHKGDNIDNNSNNNNKGQFLQILTLRAD
jgi:hypothetical protein